jgi:hypothetical protein
MIPIMDRDDGGHRGVVGSKSGWYKAATKDDNGQEGFE